MARLNTTFVMLLVLASACGGDDAEPVDDGTSDGEDAADGSPSDGSGGSDGEPAQDGSDGEPAQDGSAGDGSAGDGSAGDGSVGPSGACTNAADLAVIAGTSSDALACEGAVCAGKNLGDLLSGNTAGIEGCADSEAPALQQLSSACRQCFVDITVCVPKSCVSLLGGEDACSAMPGSDFAACENPTASEPDCEACSATHCQPTFKDCSGLE